MSKISSFWGKTNELERFFVINHQARTFDIVLDYKKLEVKS